MGVNKSRSMWSMWKARVRVEPSRQTDLTDTSVPRLHLRCAACDWGRDHAPVQTAETRCPRCGDRLLESE